MQYKVLKANFHTHTSEQAGEHSYPHYDGFYYQDLIDKFADEDYDFLAITEHHADSSTESFAEGIKYIKAKGYSLSLLAGYEHKFPDKHEELWLEIDGERLAILCHPFRYKGVDPYWRIKTSKSEGIKFIELGKQLETNSDELNRLTNYLRTENLIPIANSDLHGDYFYIYRQYTLVIAPDRSEAALKIALQAGNTVAHYVVNEKVQLISGGGPLAEQWLAGKNSASFDRSPADFSAEVYQHGNFDFNNSSPIADGIGEISLNSKTFLTFANKQLQIVFDPSRGGRIIALLPRQSNVNLTSYYSGLFKDLVPGEFISEFSEGEYQYEVTITDGCTEILFKSCASSRQPGVYIEKCYRFKHDSAGFEVEYKISSRQGAVPFKCWSHSSIAKDSTLTEFAYWDKNSNRLPHRFGTTIAIEKVGKVVFENRQQQLAFSVESDLPASFVCYEGLREFSCEIIFDEVMLTPQIPLEFKIRVNNE